MSRVTDLRSRRFAIPAIRARLAGWPSHGLRLPQTLQARAAASVLLHLVAVLVLFNAWWIGAPRLKPAGTSTGQHVTVTYNSGKPAPPRPQQVLQAQPIRRYPRASVLPAMTEELKTPPSVQGNDALGSGTVSLLYVQAFPGQKPDLSSAGATGDVVVDVEIDDTGHVAQVHARRGMGAQIDALVVATVERWVFYPALRNGQAVRSERELRFHFDRRNPDCGWECFALEEQ